MFVDGIFFTSSVVCLLVVNVVELIGSSIRPGGAAEGVKTYPPGPCNGPTNVNYAIELYDMGETTCSTKPNRQS